MDNNTENDLQENNNTVSLSRSIKKWQINILILLILILVIIMGLILYFIGLKKTSSSNTTTSATITKHHVNPYTYKGIKYYGKLDPINLNFFSPRLNQPTAKIAYYKVGVIESAPFKNDYLVYAIEYRGQTNLSNMISYQYISEYTYILAYNSNSNTAQLLCNIILPSGSKSNATACPGNNQYKYSFFTTNLAVNNTFQFYIKKPPRSISYKNKGRFIILDFNSVLEYLNAKGKLVMSSASGNIYKYSNNLFLLKEKDGQMYPALYEPNFIYNKESIKFYSSTKFTPQNLKGYFTTPESCYYPINNYVNIPLSSLSKVGYTSNGDILYENASTLNKDYLKYKGSYSMVSPQSKLMPFTQYIQNYPVLYYKTPLDLILELKSLKFFPTLC